MAFIFTIVAIFAIAIVHSNCEIDAHKDSVHRHLCRINDF